MKATCYTNLDYYDCSIVDVFVVLPRIGDRANVSFKGNITTLKVCGIIHKQKNNEPYISIELHN